MPARTHSDEAEAVYRGVLASLPKGRTRPDPATHVWACVPIPTREGEPDTQFHLDEYPPLVVELSGVIRMSCAFHQQPSFEIQSLYMPPVCRRRGNGTAALMALLDGLPFVSNFYVMRDQKHAFSGWMRRVAERSGGLVQYYSTRHVVGVRRAPLPPKTPPSCEVGGAPHRYAEHGHWC